ncbi:hypothetical protein R3P38DRAFT_2820259 [Favolaschia claudopus]|uniref:Uncharacterized protein n=1 Tax=Favolaschia claudopus TaxID=2862362 RepID=A0AAW0EDQ0_9AGAR
MAPQKPAATTQPKKKRTGGGGGKKKKGPTAYNKFVSEEMERLRNVGVDDGRERRSRAIANWHLHKEKDSNASSP